MHDTEPSTPPFPAVRGQEPTAGVDEAGRGPLAGPVVAAAVILDPQHPVHGLRDSKALSARRRDTLARQIRRNALAYSVAMATAAEIDELNILQASLMAMRRAVEALQPLPAIVQIDGQHAPAFSGPFAAIRVETHVGGDRTLAAVSAAGILAKVYRDRIMRWWHRRHPQYGFDRHKGYPVAAHIEALGRHGPCPIHRCSFAPVAACVAARSRADALAAEALADESVDLSPQRVSIAIVRE
jgi:ribonuclease HII